MPGKSFIETVIRNRMNLKKCVPSKNARFERGEDNQMRLALQPTLSNMSSLDENGVTILRNSRAAATHSVVGEDRKRCPTWRTMAVL